MIDFLKFGNFPHPDLLNKANVVGMGGIAIVGLLIGEFHREPERKGILRADFFQGLEVFNPRKVG